MPYKPTGKPPGRPRKVPVSEPATPSPIKHKRARRAFREYADHLNPSSAVQVLDSRGRPRNQRSAASSRIA